jgi:hypothetical protein
MAFPTAIGWQFIIKFHMADIAPKSTEIARVENVNNPLIERKTEITGYA